MPTVTPCEVESCEKPARTRGKCSAHYERWRKVNTTTPPPPKIRSYDGVCSVDGCEKTLRSKSYCRMHCSRLERRGTLALVGNPPPTPVAERFWAQVDRRGPSECWEWTGHRGPTGYGLIKLPGNGAPRVHPSRLSAIIHFGMFDRRLLVLHRCDNPPCVNPAHLFLGTHTDNMRDMVAKNRHRWAK